MRNCPHSYRQSFWFRRISDDLSVFVMRNTFYHTLIPTRSQRQQLFVFPSQILLLLTYVLLGKRDVIVTIILRHPAITKHRSKKYIGLHLGQDVIVKITPFACFSINSKTPPPVVHCSRGHFEMTSDFLLA